VLVGTSDELVPVVGWVVLPPPVLPESPFPFPLPWSVPDVVCFPLPWSLAGAVGDDTPTPVWAGAVAEVEGPVVVPVDGELFEPPPLFSSATLTTTTMMRTAAMAAGIAHRLALPARGGSSS
jgi:hypothetical protein